jgi:hypothetical protein
VSAFITIEYDERVHRLAYLPRADETKTLVDKHEGGELRALLALTDRSELHRSGELPLFAPANDYVGPHLEFALAPFAYLSASRFSSGNFGVFYAAHDFETAVAEAAHHMTPTYRDGDATPMRTRKQYLDARVVSEQIADVRVAYVPNVDVRLYDPQDWTAGQSFGKSIHETLDGLVSDSVRRAGGTCVGAFVPRIISDIHLQRVVEFVWDGARFAEYKETRSI